MFVAALFHGPATCPPWPSISLAPSISKQTCESAAMIRSREASVQKRVTETVSQA